jgi:hypothetical protein
VICREIERHSYLDEMISWERKAESEVVQIKQQKDIKGKFIQFEQSIKALRWKQIIIT